VGDHANDACRITATELRCKIVVEGGNLGLTQKARVEYALRGGRINTDAIDNSAGVDMSDHEVNLKILLQPALARGELSFDQRNRQLAAVAEEVARSENHLEAGRESATPTKLGSFGANAVSGTETRKVTLDGPQTPAGVARGTGTLPVVGNHGQDAHATETPAGVTTNESLRETKPIRPAGAISRHSSIPSFQPSSPMPVGQDNGAKQTRFGHSRGLGTGTV
jgi:hypothetical protein